MASRLFSSAGIYYAKVALISAAIILLLIKSEQHFSNPLVIGLLLVGGFYLGKITCSIHLKNTGIGLTLAVFILMNLIHSFIDGLSFSGQSLFYWLGAVGGHEAIRQPTLYIILWAIFQPVAMHNSVKILLCILSVTGAWLAGIWLGEVSGTSVAHFYNIADWVGYSIFLFIGDILHHLIDQYSVMEPRTHAHE